MTTSTDPSPEKLPRERHLRAAVKTFLVCMLFGPLLGASPMALYFAAVIGSTPESAVVAATKAALFVYVIGAVLGAIPAFLGGLLAAVVVWRRGTLRYHEAVLIGLASGVVGGSVFMNRADDAPNTIIGWSLFLAVCSILGALACRWLLPRLGIIPRAPALKPHPETQS